MCVQFLTPPVCVCVCVCVCVYAEMLYCRKRFYEYYKYRDFIIIIIIIIFFFICFNLGRQPPAGHSRRTTRYDSSGRVTSSSQRPLLDNTQNSQQTDNHVLVKIRTHNFNRRATAGLRFRQRGHWDRLSGPLLFHTLINNLSNAIKHSKYWIFDEDLFK